MTSRTFTLVGLLALAASMAACSGVAASDVLDSESEQTTSTAQPVPTDDTTDDGPGATPTPDKPVTPPADKPGEEKPAEPKEEPPPGLGFGCGAADMEKEPNDAPQQANPIGKVFCGQISAAQDFDFATFMLPDNARALDFKVQTQDGEVIVQVAAGNRGPETVGDGEIRVRPGEQYRIWVRSKDGKTPKYRLDAMY